MLHQAVEHTCSALTRVFTGYRPNTHNLIRLMMLVESFTKEMTKVFPRVTPQDEEISRVLHRGYLDARYKDDYEVPSTTLKLLIDRVERLQELGKRLPSLSGYGKEEVHNGRRLRCKSGCYSIR